MPQIAVSVALPPSFESAQHIATVDGLGYEGLGAATHSGVCGCAALRNSVVATSVENAVAALTHAGATEIMYEPSRPELARELASFIASVRG